MEVYDSTVPVLISFEPEDFAGAEERLCQHLWMQGKHVRGEDYVEEFALPNLLFHATTAYQLLRHHGVPLGKQDFLARLTLV